MNETGWLSDELSEQDRLKSVIWDDEQFSQYVEELGLEDALYEVSDFHASIADQLKARSVTSFDHSEWAARAINLCVRLKSRRQQLRKALRATPGGEAKVSEITAEVKEDWSE